MFAADFDAGMPGPMSSTDFSCGPSRTPQQERLNAATHGAGFFLSLMGTAVLFQSAPQMPLGRAVACGVYVTTLIAVYAVSALSHAVQHPGRKHVLRIWDQGLIYLLIAGTYTPLVWVYVPAGLRWWALLAIWAAAITGKLLKVIGRRRVSNMSTQTYLWLGWFPALLLLYFAPAASCLWMIVGGLCYTCGTIFLINDRHQRHFHAVWHIFVMLGSACHFCAIYGAVASPIT